MSQFNTISGSALRLKLKRKGISSVDICRDLGYNKTTVSRYFTNDTAMPATFIIKVAAYAKLSLHDLIDDAHIIDITPPPPAITAAAEPAPAYESKKAPDLSTTQKYLKSLSSINTNIRELQQILLPKA